MFQSNNPTKGHESFDDLIWEEFKSIQLMTTMSPSEDSMRSILNNIESTDDWQIDFWQFQTFIRQSIDSIWNQQLDPHKKTILEIALFCRIIRTASCNGVDKWFYNQFIPQIEAIVSTLKTKLACSDSEWIRGIWNLLLDEEIPIWNPWVKPSNSEKIAWLVHELLVVITRVEWVMGELKKALTKVLPKK